MKRSEYETQTAAFRARLAAEAAKPKDDQVWPDLQDWLVVPGTSTCTTPTCEAFNISFPVGFHENGDGVYRGQCGPCGQPTETALTLEEG